MPPGLVVPLVGNKVGDVVVDHRVRGSSTFQNVFLFGMAFEPRNLDRLLAFGGNGLVDSLPEVPSLCKEKGLRSICCF